MNMGIHTGGWGRLTLCLIPTALLGFEPPGALAQTSDFDRYSLSLGVFITDRDGETQLNTPGTADGTPVDLENDLGLEQSSSVFRLDGYFRFNEKHRIDFSWFDLSREATKQIEKDITWEGTLFPINATIKGDFDLAIYKLAYTWSFMRREKGYLGLTAGLYIADIAARLSSVNIADREGGDVTAPLPVIGLRGEYNLSEKWSLRASGEYFALEYGDFDGALFDFYAGVDYRLFDHMALGLGYNNVRMDIDVTAADFDGSLDWNYDGALIFVKIDF
jgi:hypothetical protein